MNIGLFADCYTPTRNGVVTSIVQLKEGLEQRGHRAVVVTVDAPQHQSRDSSVYRFPSILFNADSDIRLGLVNQRCVNRIVQEEQIDIIHTHTEFSVGRAAKRAAQKLDLPLIHTAHSMYEEYRHYLFFGRLLSPAMIRAALKRLLSRYDALVCPSVKAQNYFRSFLPEIRTVVIGNGVDRTRFIPSTPTRSQRAQVRSALGISSSDRVIMYAGRLAKEKRVLELLGVLGPHLQDNRHWKVLFVGRGPARKQMIEAARREKLSNQTIFAGSVPWEQMYRLYASADLFATASLSEVHPLTLIEASMCGLPIVARRDDSFVDLVKDGYNGYLVDSDRQIGEKLSSILSDESKLLEFSRNGLALSEHFDAKATAQRLESLYRQVVAQRTGQE